MGPGNYEPDASPRLADERGGFGRKRAPFLFILGLALIGTFILIALAGLLQGVRPAPRITTGTSSVAVALNSSPSGARVLFDGRDAGVTPLKSSLPAGLHTVELQREGCQPLRRRIELVAGSPLAATL